MHYAIQKHGWKPSDIEEWLSSDDEMKALYFASMEIKTKRDKEDEKKLKQQS